MQFYPYMLSFNNEPPTQLYSPERYEPQKAIGKGSQGMVYVAYDIKKMKFVVIKQFTRSFSNAEDVKRYCREFDLHRIVNHKNILKLEYAYTTADSISNFNDMYLVTELMDSNLNQFQKNNRGHFTHRCGGDFIGLLIHSILSALTYLHLNNLAHRDITPANILVKKYPEHKFNYVFKLADFGLSRKLPEDVNQNITKDIGTMFYRAPEIILTGNYRLSVDLWSVGCILYEMIIGNILFKIKNQHDTHALLNLIVDKISLSDEEFFSLPKYIIDYTLKRNINYYQDKLDQFLPDDLHVWPVSHIGMKEFRNLLHQMLEFDPQNRITAAKALNLDIWDYLQKCSFYPFENDMEIINQNRGEYDSNGDAEYYKKILFERLNEYQAMIANNSNS